MLRVIEAKADKGLESMLRVVTTLRKKTFDIVDLEMTSSSSESNFRIVLLEHPDRSGEMALGYLRQIYELREVNLVSNEPKQIGR